MNLSISEIILLIVTGGISLYMAWTIGANDVANAMGTSVGSGTLKLRKALVIAAVFEFLGAILVGRHVTKTVSEGIIDPELFMDEKGILIAGMLSVLLGSAIWVTTATYFALPVSTGHSIIGGIFGFGIVCALFGQMGIRDIQFGTIGNIAASWIISPIAGGILSYLIYLLIIKSIHHSERPSERAKFIVPFFAGLVIFILFISFLYKGLDSFNIEFTIGEALGVAAILGGLTTLFSLCFLNFIHKTLEKDPMDHVQQLFGYLLIVTACYIAFAHGASDVSHAIGPTAAIFQVGIGSVQGSGTGTIIILLILGAVGIVIGLATWGHKVMKTIGEKIASISPAQGFAATFGGATTVLVCARLGLPISTSQVLVGTVVGVGLVHGRKKFHRFSI